jgi:hypothetical protein
MAEDAEQLGVDDVNKSSIVPAYVGAETRTIVQALASSERRTMSSMARLLIEEALTARGLLPANPTR